MHSSDSTDSRPDDALSAAQRAAVAKVLSAYPVADELGRRFQQAGFRLALVGGSVRDDLVEREVLDDRTPCLALGLVWSIRTILALERNFL